jgi:hypothetical protein
MKTYKMEKILDENEIIGDKLKTNGIYVHKGLAIAQAVSCQLPTAVTKVQTQVKSCWICGG